MALRTCSGGGMQRVVGAALGTLRLGGFARSASETATSGSGTGSDVNFGYTQVPRTEHKDLVKDVFNKVATSYDVMNDFMSFFMHRAWKDKLVETLHPFPGQVHIDVAGGTGDVAFRVLKEIRKAEHVFEVQQHKAYETADQGSVYVCDINGAMLEEGKKKADSLDVPGVAEGLQWVESDAESLPFDDNSFDTYSISFGIRNVSNIGKGLEEAHRVLRKGGHFCCLEFSQVNSEVLRKVYDLYSMNVIPHIGSAVAGDGKSYRYLVESIRKFPDQETFSEMIRAAGFSQVRHENLLDGVVAIHSGFKM